MKKINVKARVKNKVFWVTLIPAILLLIQSIAAISGISLDLSALQDKLLDMVNAVFGVLVVLGVVVDPLTKGVGDGETGLTYTEPK